MTWIVYSYGILAVTLAALLLPQSAIRRMAYLLGGGMAALLVLIGATSTLIDGSVAREFSFHLSVLPALDFRLDALRGFFLLITAVVYASSIAFVGHEAKGDAASGERALLGLTTFLFMSMVSVLLSASVLSLVFTWELMSLTLWALVSFDMGKSENRRASYLTLAMSEAGSLAALAGLLILAEGAGTSNLAGIAVQVPQLSQGVVWAGLLLTFFGFGVKTGILPVNVWMSSAYAAAPRSVTPIFSGASLNLGVFTLLIIDGPLATHHLTAALLVLVVGALTALLGIVYALVETGMTRLLTQSSIENLGIIVAALGAGFSFAALEQPTAAGIALIAGMYHTLNHSMFKTLLFLGAAGIGDAMGGDDLDRLGGLMRRVPLFGVLFLIGSMAIAALPPLNGFVSEWLTLESLLRVVEVDSVPVRMTFAFSGAVLALTAGLALTCFTLLAGSTLLGLSRSEQAGRIQSMPISVTAPMAVLAFICFGLGVLATAVIPALGPLVASLAGTDAGPALVPAFFQDAPELTAAIFTDLGNIGARIGADWLPLRGLVVLHSGGENTPVIFAMSTALSALVIILILAAVWLAAYGVRRRRKVTRARLWDAGLAQLLPEMTYNATAFASPVRVLFDALLRPVVAESIESEGAFATNHNRQSQIVHIVDRLTARPVIASVRKLAEWISQLHHGRVTTYASYVLVVLLVMLVVSNFLLD